MHIGNGRIVPVQVCSAVNGKVQQVVIESVQGDVRDLSGERIHADQVGVVEGVSTTFQHLTHVDLEGRYRR